MNEHVVEVWLLVMMQSENNMDNLLEENSIICQHWDEN
jgi:hypothetical protein